MTYIQPVYPGLTLLILILLVSMSRRESKRRSHIALLAGAALLLWGWPPVAWLVSGSLEWQYPVLEAPAGDVQAIVVLGSGAVQANASQPEPSANLSTYRRALYAAWLYKHWKAVPVVASGGPAPVAIVSRAIRRVVESEGVPAEMVWTEERSASTYQNARFTAAILRAHGINKIALVTEAYHMPRSVGSFRKQGLVVMPAPCSYRTLEFTKRWPELIPNAGSMTHNEDALHEWVGLIWYKASGKI